MNAAELADKYTAWMEEHLTPVRTSRGSIATRCGAVRYELPDTLPRLLGGSFVEPAERLRRGDDVSPEARRAVAELVDACDIPAILRLRRDQKLAIALRSALAMHREHGCAPDGGNIEEWATAKRTRMDAFYGADGVPLGGEAERLWQEIFKERLAPANRRRRERYAA